MRHRERWTRCGDCDQWVARGYLREHRRSGHGHTPLAELGDGTRQGGPT